MTWFDWLLVGLLALNAVVSVLLVGEPREPIKPATAALVVMLNSTLVFGVFATSGGGA